jgi:hypothetical protein
MKEGVMICPLTPISQPNSLEISFAIMSIVQAKTKYNKEEDQSTNLVAKIVQTLGFLSFLLLWRGSGR